MDINVIGVNEKIINLTTIAMCEDITEDGGETTIKLYFTDGLEIEISGDDAEMILQRYEIIIEATNKLLANLQATAASLETDS